MLVPFDEIYNYISDVAGDDIIIYRWYPHGSKNLVDLSESRLRHRSWRGHMESTIMIMHDQEPLHWDLYSADVMHRDIVSWYQHSLAPLHYQAACAEVRDHISALNLAAICYGTVTSDVNILCHSEVNSPHVDRYRDVGLVPVYWWSHAAIARDWYRYAQHDPSLTNLPQKYQQDFVVYNRAWAGSREYRLKFADLILEKALVPAAKIAFAPHDQGHYWRDHVFANPAFRPSNDLEWLPANTTHSNHSAAYSRDDYRDCWWDVVLETLYDDSRWHLTEKTLRPIACGKPFLLLGTPGSLQYLRSYGFRTFGNIIDESYDQETDPVRRMLLVTEVMEHIRQLSTVERRDMHRAITDITAHNKQRFFSQEFIQEIWQEFTTNLAAAHDYCQSTKQGRNWMNLRRMLRRDPVARPLVLADNARRTCGDVLCLIRECRSRR